LIVGGDSDPNTRRVVDQAHIRDVDYHFWDTDVEGGLQIAWDFNERVLDLGDHHLQPAAIFARCNVFSQDKNLPARVHQLIQAYALAWPDVRILNRPTLNTLNNKSLNLRLARELGLTIPDTIVLGDCSPLTTIPDAEDRIAKPLDGGAHTMLVSQLNQQIAQSQWPNTSYFIQPRLAGENLRVFVINQEPYCFHLATQSLDYRDDLWVEVKQIPTPGELIAPALALAKQIGFDYCALDFRCTAGFDNPVFLEINSFPMFVRFDDAGENCLVDAILDFLVTGV
jgi:glutathione synthase/RimK-type ligase-like ATP-grasp enzyme